MAVYDIESVSAKINEVINSFLEENGFECKADLGINFSYDYPTSTIYYSLLASDKFEKSFTKLFFERGLKYDCGIFIISLFHELGHDQTLDLISEEEENTCFETKKQMNSSEITDEVIQTYYHLPDEIKATDWGVNYINEHIDIIKTMAEKVKAITDDLFSCYEK